MKLEAFMKMRLHLVTAFVCLLGTASAPAFISPQRTAGAEVTVKSVAAANAFLAALDPKQRTAVVLPLNKDTRSRWSNLPNGAAGLTFKRNGLKFGDLTAVQQQAALD